MRPDEHKRKKNAAYKKKHGITKETNDKRDEKSTGERRNEPPAKKSGQSKTQLSTASSHRERATVTLLPTAGGLRTDKVKEEDSSSSNSSDSETETHNIKKPSQSFSRRQVVSNWQKYELQPDGEENVSTRGENYEKLLSMAGDAISHFRFKDELAWEDPSNSTNDHINDTYSEFLSVNPVELGQSLACLPLHQTLGISPDVFPAEQLSSMIGIAKDRSSIYSANVLLKNTRQFVYPATKDVSIEASNDSRLLTSQESDKQSNLFSSLGLIVKKKPILTTTPELKIVNTATSFITSDASKKSQQCLQDKKDYSSTDHTPKRAFSADNFDITLDKSDKKLQLHDEDLDSILGLDNPAAEVPRDIKETTSQKQPTTVTSTCESVIKPITGQESTASENSKMATENTDLEAWLDSILDD